MQQLNISKQNKKFTDANTFSTQATDLQVEILSDTST